MAGPGARVKLIGTACVTHRDDRLLPTRARVLPRPQPGGQPGPRSGMGRWKACSHQEHPLCSGFLPPPTMLALEMAPDAS